MEEPQRQITGIDKEREIRDIEKPRPSVFYKKQDVMIMMKRLL